MRVTLRQLSGFVVAARLKSFSAGARELAMTQPAFSQMIAALELATGVQLFDRSTRRMQLTDVGVQLLGMIERPLDDIDDAYLFLRDIASGKRGRLVFSSVGYGFVAAAIVQYKKAFPNVGVKMLDDPNATLITRVLNRSVDFGFGTYMTPHKELVYEEVLRDELVAVSREGHLSSTRKLTWRALQREPLILFPKQSGIRALVDRQLATARIPREPAFEVPNAIAALSMVRAGFGIAILPQLILGELNMNELDATQIFEPRPERSIGIISRLDRPLSAAATAYVKFMRAEVAFGKSKQLRRPS